jgi:error-prone DNA polymerase
MDFSLDPAVSSTLPSYAELHCLSNFSFQRGASHPGELVERAAELGYAALAITDECSLAGAVRAHAAARETALKLIVGTEVAVAGMKLVLLASDRKAYGAISSLITTGRRRGEKGTYSLEPGDFDAVAQSGALALLAGSPDEAQALWLKERFGERAWIAAELHLGAGDRQKKDFLAKLSKKSGLPLAAAGDVHMHVRSRRALQDVLTAVRLGKPVAQCGHALFPNAERHLRMRMRLARIYPPEWLAETMKIAERCTFSMKELEYQYPDEIVPPGETPASYLRKLTEAGLREKGLLEKCRSQMEKELELIADLRYEPFFLTVYDVVQFARSRRILCQGRGSAANSLVCYALDITAVGPGRLEMLVERFISRERDEPPDIDVDFEHERREDVIQYIYGKYGRERAAIAATVITWQPKSALRDVGKALGLGEEDLDRISGSMAWWDGRHVMPERLREAGIDPSRAPGAEIAGLVEELVGFPRHLSQHVGGFVISRGPLAELVPVENAAMPERTVIQWDKTDLEEMKLIKVDVLALGMLSAIRKSLDALGIRNMSDIPEGDDGVYRMIQAADTIGVFQIESRAQMSMLPRLRPREYYDLVVQVAIVRPGPIQGGMVHPYLRNRQLPPDRISYPKDPKVRAVLERTLGVPIFQEQVMQLSMVAAGFSAGEADALRRAMGAWQRKGTLEKFEEKLRAGMRVRNHDEEFIVALIRQMRGFGEYGFPESHSASFALLAYVSAWIKHHHPAVFCAALLNSQPMGFYQPPQLVQDARSHGVEVRPVRVGASAWDCTLEEGALRLGLRMVKGLSEAAGKRIAENGPYGSPADLAHRAQLGRKEMRSLAAAGALEPLAGHRRLAHWEAAGAESRPPLGVPRAEKAPALSAPTEGQDIAADYASVGLTLGRHPLALLRRRLDEEKFMTAEKLRAAAPGSRGRAAGLVIGRQRPQTASGVVFVTLEDETGCVNLVVWRDLVERQRRELLGARLLGVQGVIERDGDVVHLIAHRLSDRSRLLGALQTVSRDFH